MTRAKYFSFRSSLLYSSISTPVMLKDLHANEILCRCIAIVLSVVQWQLYTWRGYLYWCLRYMNTSKYNGSAFFKQPVILYPSPLLKWLLYSHVVSTSFVYNMHVIRTGTSGFIWWVYLYSLWSPIQIYAKLKCHNFNMNSHSVLRFWAQKLWAHMP